MGQVIEHHQPVGHPEWVVICQRDDAGTQLDPLGPLRRGRDENLRRGDDLAARGMMLADPRLVETERVEVLDELEISLHGQRRVSPCAVKRCDEIPEPEPGHERSPSSRVVQTLNPSRAEGYEFRDDERDQPRRDSWAWISGAIFSAMYAWPASLGCTPSGPINSGRPTNQPSLIGSMNVAPASLAWPLRMSRRYRTSIGGSESVHGGPITSNFADGAIRRARSKVSCAMAAICGGSP